MDVLIVLYFTYAIIRVWQEAKVKSAALARGEKVDFSNGKSYLGWSIGAAFAVLLQALIEGARTGWSFGGEKRREINARRAARDRPGPTAGGPGPGWRPSSRPGRGRPKASAPDNPRAVDPDDDPVDADEDGPTTPCTRCGAVLFGDGSPPCRLDPEHPAWGYACNVHFDDNFEDDNFEDDDIEDAEVVDDDEADPTENCLRCGAALFEDGSPSCRHDPDAAAFGYACNVHFDSHCAACGRPAHGRPGHDDDPLVLDEEGTWIHRSHLSDPTSPTSADLGGEPWATVTPAPIRETDGSDGRCPVCQDYAPTGWECPYCVLDEDDDVPGPMPEDKRRALIEEMRAERPDELLDILRAPDGDPRRGPSFPGETYEPIPTADGARTAHGDVIDAAGGEDLDPKGRTFLGEPLTAAQGRSWDLRDSGYTGWIDQDGYPTTDEQVKADFPAAADFVDLSAAQRADATPADPPFVVDAADIVAGTGDGRQMTLVRESAPPTDFRPDGRAGGRSTMTTLANGEIVDIDGCRTYVTQLGENVERAANDQIETLLSSLASNKVTDPAIIGAISEMREALTLVHGKCAFVMAGLEGHRGVEEAVNATEGVGDTEFYKTH